MKASPLGGGLLEYLQPEMDKVKTNQIQGKSVQQNQGTQTTTSQQSTPQTINHNFTVQAKGVVEPITKEIFRNSDIVNQWLGKNIPVLEKGSYTK